MIVSYLVALSEKKISLNGWFEWGLGDLNGVIRQFEWCT